MSKRVQKEVKNTKRNQTGNRKEISFSVQPGISLRMPPKIFREIQKQSLTD